MKHIRNSMVILLAAALGAGAAPGAGTNAGAAMSMADLLPDVTVAKGKGFEIKRSQLDQFVVGARSEMAARQQQVPPDQLPMLEKNVLDEMILVQLLNRKATEEQKAKGKEESDKAFENLKKQAPSEDMLIRQLKITGTTPEQLHAIWREKATASVVLRAKVNVTDEQVKKFYDDNPAKFEDPEYVKISYITLGAQDPNLPPLTDEKKAAKRKQAEELVKRARAGEDFGKLVKDFTEDRDTKEFGAVVALPRGQRGVPPEFERAAFALQTNQVSDVVATTVPFGYHVIKLVEKNPARKATLSEASASVRNYLEAQEINKFVPQYFPELKKEAGVEYVDEKMKTLEDNPPAKPDAAK